ncbi:MAG: O-antigen ligase family protein [bacterium]|nr:O-antigen ligase family protein [bacterium]
MLRLMSVILRAFRFLDDHLLMFLAGFLLVFIPLYPKWPLLELIPGYIVRVRLEDFFILLTFFVWVIQMLRGKTRFGKTTIAKPIFVYLLVGFLSVLSAMFITQTLPLNQPHIIKLFLHYFRRIEYFSLFFIVFSSLTTMRQVRIFLILAVAVVYGVIVYGYGQKYLYWPAFSTMNREFSKGWWLYLTEHARVLSTFGGHYDLAAYLVIVMTVAWSFFFGIKKLLLRIATGFMLAGAFWLLILTASRTSFLAYLAGTVAMLFVYVFSRGFRWSVVRGIFIVVLSIGLMLSFGDLSERFTKLFGIDKLKQQLAFNPLKPIGQPPKDNAYFLENNIAAVTSKSDQPPSVGQPGRQGFGGLVGKTTDEEPFIDAPTPSKERRPFDVYEDIPLPIASTDSATGTSSVVYVPRTYSDTAMLFDLSTGIRFDALWPRAWQGFLRNPLLGSGYSTLTKETQDQFTEAESTDNDYLRALGETGLLGFLTFGAILAIVLKTAFGCRKEKDPMLLALSAGVFGAVVGILTNAIYIDVFEASKVAYTFWSLVGIFFAAVWIKRKKTA